MRTAVTTQNMARSIEQTVEGMIDTVDVTLLTSADEIARQLATGKLDVQASSASMGRHLKRLPYMSYLRAADERGDVIYGPGVLSPPNNISDRDYFIRLRDDPKADVLVSRHLIGRIAGKWAWLFVRRINKVDGSFGGVVFAGILTDQIEGLFLQLQMDTGGSIALRDVELGLIARYPPASATTIPSGDKRLSTSFVAALKANPREGTYISGVTSIDNINRTHSYRRSAKYDFIVNVGIARETSLAAWRTQVWVVAGLVVAYIFASLVFSWLISRAWRRQEQDVLALQSSQQALREAQEIANLGHYAYDLRTRRWTSSDILDGIFGIGSDYPRDDVHWLELVASDSRPDLRAYLNDVVGQRIQFDREYRIVRPSDGEERWVHGKGRLQLDAQGNPLALVGTIQDITARKVADEKLHLLASVFSHAREGIMITAADGAIIDVNDAFSRITGYAHEAVLGRNPRLLNSGRQAKDYYAAMWHDLIENGYWYGEVWNRRANGEMFAAMQTISAVRDAHGKTRQYVALFSDITPLKEHQKELEHLAHYDTLTTLPNRMLLSDRLQQAMAQAQRRGRRLAVAYLDLDGFKTINDNHGHQAGDQVLKAVAARMKQALREGDTLARMGGDEFVAVLVDLADAAASLPMLTRLLAAAAEPVQVGELALQVSASLGVTFYPQAEDIDADHIVRQADQAMYQAKLAGKNRYHVFDGE